MRRLRAAGKIPAVLYGHGLENVNLSIDSRDVDRMIRETSHIVELKGDVNESALVKDVQWDAIGSDVVHIDLARIDATESVEVTLNVELRGSAPGSNDGGIVMLQVHDIEMRCPANQLPDSIEININHLELNGVITAADLEIPAVAELLIEPTTVIVTCELPQVIEEPEAGEVADGAAEPEVIGAKDDEDESEGND
jgi:large subunit ribosomal protein L25